MSTLIENKQWERICITESIMQHHQAIVKQEVGNVKDSFRH